MASASIHLNSPIKGSGVAIARGIPLGMLATENKIALLPLGGWQQWSCPQATMTQTVVKSSALEQGNSGFFWVSTTFAPCGISIEPPSTTEVISIVCLGVLSIRCIFTRDRVASSGPPSDEDGVSVIELPVALSPGYIDEINGPRTVSFRTPYPCSKVDVMLLQRNTDFFCIFKVSTFCSSSVRSSSMSTPQSKGPHSSSLPYK